MSEATQANIIKNLILDENNNIRMNRGYELPKWNIDYDNIRNLDENTTYVGTSDLFQREPKEIIYSTTGKIGCNNRFSAIITHRGYLVCDVEKGEIYLVKNDQSVSELSDLGFKEWFK